MSLDYLLPMSPDHTGSSFRLIASTKSLGLLIADLLCLRLAGPGIDCAGDQTELPRENFAFGEIVSVVILSCPYFTTGR